VLTQTPAEQKRRFYESSNSEIYRNFLDWLDTNTPYVANHLDPVSQNLLTSGSQMCPRFSLADEGV
jgi:hypothetical protein